MNIINYLLLGNKKILFCFILSSIYAFILTQFLYFDYYKEWRLYLGASQIIDSERDKPHGDVSQVNKYQLSKNDWVKVRIIPFKLDVVLSPGYFISCFDSNGNYSFYSLPRGPSYYFIDNFIENLNHRGDSASDSVIDLFYAEFAKEKYQLKKWEEIKPNNDDYILQKTNCGWRSIEIMYFSLVLVLILMINYSHNIRINIVLSFIVIFSVFFHLISIGYPLF